MLNKPNPNSFHIILTVAKSNWNPNPVIIQLEVIITKDGHANVIILNIFFFLSENSRIQIQMGNGSHCI